MIYRRALCFIALYFVHVPARSTPYVMCVNVSVEYRPLSYYDMILEVVYCESCYKETSVIIVTITRAEQSMHYAVVARN